MLIFFESQTLIITKEACGIEEIYQKGILYKSVTFARRPFGRATMPSIATIFAGAIITQQYGLVLTDK